MTSKRRCRRKLTRRNPSPPQPPTAARCIEQRATKQKRKQDVPEKVRPAFLGHLLEGSVGEQTGETEEEGGDEHDGEHDGTGDPQVILLGGGSRVCICEYI